MPYCVHCGVKIAEEQKDCPLCKTPVIDPATLGKETVDSLIDSQKHDEFDYLEFTQAVNRTVTHHRGFVSGIFSFVLFAAFLVSLVVDLSVNSTLTWSFYTMSSIVTAWFIVWFPIIYRGRSKKTALVYDLLFINIYLLLIDNSVEGVSWSWFPVTAVTALCGLLMIIRFSRTLKYWGILFFSALDVTILLLILDFLTPGRWFLPLALPITAVTYGIFIIVSRIIIHRDRNRSVESNGYLYAAIISIALSTELIALNIILSLFIDYHPIISWAHFSLFFTVPIIVFCLIAHNNEKLRTLLRKKFRI